MSIMLKSPADCDKTHSVKHMTHKLWAAISLFMIKAHNDLVEIPSTAQSYAAVADTALK